MNFYFSDEGSTAMVPEKAKVKDYDFSNLPLLKQDKTYDVAVTNQIEPANTFCLDSLPSPREDLSLAMLQSSLNSVDLCRLRGPSSLQQCLKQP